MQKPTVGRHVHFYFGGDSTPLAATICRVNSDTRVNLMVVRGDGSTFGQEDVELVPDGTPRQPLYKCCVWPPREKSEVQEAAERGFAGT
jgi:hypothetical protein